MREVSKLVRDCTLKFISFGILPPLNEDWRSRYLKLLREPKNSWKILFEK
jgi:hypothetical protein